MFTLGAVIALSAFSTVNLTMSEIHWYEVEKWQAYYKIALMSSSNHELGNLVVSPPIQTDPATLFYVDIDDDRYVVRITEEDDTWGTAKFLQHGEVIGRITIYKNSHGEIELRDVSPSLDQFIDTFELVISISEDPAFIRAMRTPLPADGISGFEAFWCGVGAMGASIVSTPIGGFFYAVSCGLLADLDSWGSGVGSGGGSSSSGSGGTTGPGGGNYPVVKIWR